MNASETPTTTLTPPAGDNGRSTGNVLPPTAPAPLGTPAHAAPSPSPAPVPPPASGGGRRRVATGLAVVVGLAIGLGAGVAGRERVLHWLGQHDHAETSGVAADGVKQLWTCGMHPQVIQDKPGSCPICGMDLEPLKTDASVEGPASTERQVKYWWDPMMNPPYISEAPGKSPMGMDLIPVYADEVSGGTAITIDPAVVQNMGVRVGAVTRGPVERTVRAVGYLELAQPRTYDVNLRVSGWVEKLHADTEGMRIKKGDPLFEIYSPEVQVAIEELIIAHRGAKAITAYADATTRETAEVLLDAAERKLQQWGLSGEQIAELAKLDKAPRTVTYYSPADGDLFEKSLVQGASVMSGDRALRIVDRSVLWLDAQVYAQDLPFVAIGRTVTATIESSPGETFEGKIVFIAPSIDATTRTAMVRMEVANADLSLRPGMYATAQISAELLKDATLVPREAVIDTGTRQVVFVALGGGDFEPRLVKVGPSSAKGDVQVLSGLRPGEAVVTSGQFLMDSESRMKEAIQKHLRDKLVRAPGNAAAVAAHAGHDGTGAPSVSSPVERPAHDPVMTDRVDAAVQAYLRIAEQLGAVQTSDKPVDPSALIGAAEALGEAHGGSLLVTARALEGEALGNQRELFKATSEALLELVGRNPPSQKVGPKLYVMHCPMAKGSWLQATPEKANPYYATGMKQCASLKKTIETTSRS